MDKKLESILYLSKVFIFLFLKIAINFNSIYNFAGSNTSYYFFMRLLISIISILFVAGCKPPEVPVYIQKGIDSIAFRWVPDQREGICRFNLTMLPNHDVLIKGETNLPEAKSEIINYLVASGLTYSDSLVVLPDTLVIQKPWGLVTVSVCNIKSDPSHSSELVSQAIMGTPVKVLKKRGGWLLIQTPDYYIGWANESGILEMSEAEIQTWKRSDRLIYTSKSGDILSATEDSGLVSDIVAGSIMKFVAQKWNFFMVELPDGRRGKVRKINVSDFKQWCSYIKPEADKLVLFSKSLTGSPYLWGGTSIKAIDCSGFSKTIYFTSGIILARDASLQFRHGTPVDISSSIDPLEPGDLVFFGHYYEGVKRITHVGMYIGDSEVIHASGMVRINSLDSTRANYSNFHKETIMGARRIKGLGSEKGIESVAMHSWYN